jgi:hypothetical protein
MCLISLNTAENANVHMIVLLALHLAWHCYDEKYTWICEKFHRQWNVGNSSRRAWVRTGGIGDQIWP